MEPTTVVAKAGEQVERIGARSWFAPQRVLVTGAGPIGLPDAGTVNRDLVLENDVAVGSVNADLRHCRQAAEALGKAGTAWLDRLITRRVPLDRFADAFTSRPGDVKTVITLDA